MTAHPATSSAAAPPSGSGAEKIDPTRAAAGFARWRRALAEARGEDPGALLDRPDRRLTMLRIFGSTRRLADLCLKHPAAAAQALMDDGPSLVLAEAARDLSGLNGGVGGADALHGALSPVKSRADLAIAIAEFSGAWSPSKAAVVRADFAVRLVETALSWLVRAAVSRGELAAPADAGHVANVFSLAGGDFAHEDLAPYGPLEIAVIYDERAFDGPAARMAERAFVRIGAELREAFEGKPGEYPLFTLKTPLGSGVNGAGLTEAQARVKAALADPQQNALRAWIATARVVAGDRSAGGAFLEEVEEAVWRDLRPFEKGEADLAIGDDPRTPFRRIADSLRYAFGAARPVFRTAPAHEVIEIAAEAGAFPADVARRLSGGDAFAQKLVSRAQMMKGFAAYNPARPDEEAALAALCGFRSFEALSTTLAGLLADAANSWRRLCEGPFAEFDRYKAEGESADDVDKLEDLGFRDGADLSGLIDHWINIASARMDGVRFSEIAPGLLTSFGETQHPDDAVRLFDALLRAAPDSEEALGKAARSGPVRNGLVDALGCFGAAIAPLTEKSELAAECFDERGQETPVSGEEWISRYTPPGVKAKIADLGAWRRENIARVALCAASGAMPFGAAAEALEAIHNRTLSETFAAVGRELKGGEGLSLHVFDGPARGLPGTASLFGFIASGGKAEANEEFARRFMGALEELGQGFFAFAPDVSHRPGGACGALAPDVAAVKSYIQSEAVASDQILLARARLIAGTPEARKAAKAALRTGVANSRRADILFRDLDRARAQRLRRDKAGSDWDIDQAEGGLYDVELIISTLIYRHAAAQPATQEGGVNNALDTLARANLISADVAETLKSARAFWTRLATARALARWTDPQREPVRKRFATLLARAAEVERFSQIRPLMRGYAEETSRLYAQLVLGRPSLSLAAGA